MRIRELLALFPDGDSPMRLPRRRCEMEDDKSQARSCVCEGREYANQEKVCQKNSCYICHDGSWESYSTLSTM